MKKIIAISVVLFVSLLCAYAQNDVKVMMNSIKKNPAYIYGEATLPSLEDAASAARDLLKFNVNLFIKENPDSLEIYPVSINSLSDSCDVLNVERGSMMRALAYLHKSAFSSFKDVVDVQVAVPVMSWKEQFEDSMKNVSDMFILYNVLDGDMWKDHTSYGKVKYDTPSDNLAKSYLVVFSADDYAIHAILSPKNGGRVNIVTREADSTKNYPNCQAVWVKTDF